MTTTTPIPDHVPPNVVRDFDFFSQPDLLDNPHRAIENIFSDLTPRVFFTPRNGGHWVIGGYKELQAAFRDVKTFSSTTMQIPTMAEEPKMIPLNLDPPEHGVYRAPIAKALDQDNVHPMEHEIRALTQQLIAGIDQNETEFVSTIAEPLPIYIFLQILGVPREKFRDFRDNVKAFFTKPEERLAVTERLNSEFAELIQNKMDNPANDLLSTLIGYEIDGRKPTFDELISYVRLLMLAGLDTVTNAMSFGMHHLAVHQDLQQQLRDDPAKIPATIEELLRRYSFVNLGRICLRDSEVSGIQFKEGDRVLLMLAGGGIDPVAYTNPEGIDLDREGKPLPTFGFGRHHCAGVHLARLELKIMYQEWLSTIPTFNLKESDPPQFHGGVVLGLEKLPLRWS